MMSGHVKKINKDRAYSKGRRILEKPIRFNKKGGWVLNEVVGCISLIFDKVVWMTKADRSNEKRL